MKTAAEINSKAVIVFAELMAEGWSTLEIGFIGHTIDSRANGFLSSSIEKMAADEEAKKVGSSVER